MKNYLQREVELLNIWLLIWQSPLPLYIICCRYPLDTFRWGQIKSLAILWTCCILFVLLCLWGSLPYYSSFKTQFKGYFLYAFFLFPRQNYLLFSVSSYHFVHTYFGLNPCNILSMWSFLLRLELFKGVFIFVFSVVGQCLVNEWKNEWMRWDRNWVAPKIFCLRKPLGKDADT